MRDEALIEGAVADAVPEGTSVAEVADLDFDGDARAAALDLSLADGRFAPDVLEIAARRAVSAWAEAVDGEDSALASIAHPQAVQHLLHPGDPSQKTRLVVRGPKVTQIRITGLDAAATPPTMSDRGRDRRQALHRGPRHGGGRRGQSSRARRRSPSTGRSRSTATPPSRGGSPRSARPSATRSAARPKRGIVLTPACSRSRTTSRPTGSRSSPSR